MERGQDVRTSMCFISSALCLMEWVMDPDEGRACGGQEAVSIFLYLEVLIVSSLPQME